MYSKVKYSCHSEGFALCHVLYVIRTDTEFVISVTEFLKCVTFIDHSTNNEVPLEQPHLLLRLIGCEASVAQPVVRLPSASGSGTDIEDDLKAGPILFMFPGSEGMASGLQPLARNLKYQTVCLQLGYSHMGQTVQEMAESLLPVQITLIK
jgi:hypothetical protein